MSSFIAKKLDICSESRSTSTINAAGEGERDAAETHASQWSIKTCRHMSDRPIQTRPPTAWRGCSRSVVRVTTRLDHRHHARPHRFGQAWPSVDDRLQVGREVRRFRFNCYHICSHALRNIRFSQCFRGLASGLQIRHRGFNSHRRLFLHPPKPRPLGRGFFVANVRQSQDLRFVRLGGFRLTASRIPSATVRRIFAWSAV